MIINDTIVLNCYSFDPAGYSAPAKWVGHCFVDSIKGNIFYNSAVVYFHPGDSVTLKGYGIIKEPGYYIGNGKSCYDNCSFKNEIHCQYLPDTLETYYRYHFDQHFIDSLVAAELAFNDSVAAVPAAFYPNPVSESITFECFKTIQEPFDFSAYDLQGRCLLTRRVEFSDSYQTRTIDVSALESGTYIVKYFINEKPYTRQILKL